jgi:class 3 adenylate cyclase
MYMMTRPVLPARSMNLAARLETSCPPGRIHVSAHTCALLPEEDWEPVGGVELKGQGRMVSPHNAATLQVQAYPGAEC